MQRYNNFLKLPNKNEFIFLFSSVLVIKNRLLLITSKRRKNSISKNMLVFLHPFLRPYKRIFLVVWVTDCILCYCVHYRLKMTLNVISCDLCIVILFHNVIYLFCCIYFMVYLLFSFAVNFLY